MSVFESITERRLGAAGVVAKLDQLTIAEVIGLLGHPDREVRNYAQPTAVRLEDDTVGPAWKVGDDRPALATEDPAEVVAMNLCLIARNPWLARSAVTERHPARCGFCDYPDLELHRAIAHATYFSRLVRDHLLVWTGVDHELYIRAGSEDGRFQSPVWDDFDALPDAEQRRSVAEVNAAIREGVTA